MKWIILDSEGDVLCSKASLGRADTVPVKGSWVAGVWFCSDRVMREGLSDKLTL